ncbi:MAG: prepilin-type N-terminal cleavage/methylation domain-containing protein [Candidatus Methylomirabilales bacterium]
MGRERGFTLIELILVVVVVAILAAILVPTVLSILDDSAVTKGKADAKAIAGAVVAFRKDVGEFPTRDASGAAGDEVNLLYSGTTAPLVTTFGGASPATEMVSFDCTTAANCESFEFPFFTNVSTSNAYDTPTDPDDPTDKGWKGPYISENAIDEFGSPYIIYVSRLRRADKVTSERSFVVFAGPDKIYDTTPSATTTQDDDFAFLIK